VKLLFVSSGNKTIKVSEIIKNQGDSLVSKGWDVDYFLIKGSGLTGYLRNIIPLRKVLVNNNYNIIHAHYFFSAIVASFTFKKPVIVSLMGSEVSKSNIYLSLIKFFNKKFWSGCIVKTNKMKEALKTQNINVLPNGVDMKRFMPLDKSFCQKKLNWLPEKKHVLFASWPERPEKNFQLAKDSVTLLPSENIELHYLKGIPNDQIIYYYNAADVVLLTSKREGSPNVIKEAMACNRPIISTDVGDVSELVRNLGNCYITSFDPSEIAGCISKALKCNSLPDGRKRLIELGLDSESVADKLILLYEKAIGRN